MHLFLNPIILLFISFLVSFMSDVRMERIVPLLIATICACFSYVISNKKYTMIFVVAYFVLCGIYREFMYFLPVVVYMSIQNDAKRYMLIYFIPCLLYIRDDDIYIIIIAITELIFAILLKLQYLKSVEKDVLFRKQRDATKELALAVTSQNKDLMIQQEQEIRIATLAERNRIAREIHDNVGHLLSSSLLQIGAIQILEQDETIKNALLNLRETMSTAMDSVRNSVHDLHDDALELDVMISKLISRYTFCEVILEYDVIHSFKPNVIYHIMAIIKECMNNTMKHSNANKLQIVIREQPAFFQIICKDNGNKHSHLNDGIGLQNIQDRIEDLHGYVNISAEDGFKVFITLPKEETICEW